METEAVLSRLPAFFPYGITEGLRVIREESLRHQDIPHQTLRVIGKQLSERSILRWCPQPSRGGGNEPFAYCRLIHCLRRRAKRSRKIQSVAGIGVETRRPAR